MRFFAVICSIYLLALAIMPCNDVTNDCTVFSPQTETSGNHHDNEIPDDMCSPFCTCACCSISANPDFKLLEFENIKPIVISEIICSTYDFSLGSDYYGTIWKPPKA